MRRAPFLRCVMSKNLIAKKTTPPEKLSYPHKLLPFVLVAEAGLAVFLIGYCVSVFSGIESAFVLICVLSAVAAIVFTILYAVNIKPRLTMAAAMVCISLAVFLFLLLAAISNFTSIVSYRSQLALIESEDVKATILQNINRNTLLGSVWLVFAVLILPLSVYLPIWWLRRSSNA